MAPIRVLQVMPAMDAGGMETFVMNVYRTIDREQVQFDFLYHYNKTCFFDDEIQALGGRCTISSPSGGPTSIVASLPDQVPPTTRADE